MGFSKVIAFLSIFALFYGTIAEDNGAEKQNDELTTTTMPTPFETEGGTTPTPPTETSTMGQEEKEEDGENKTNGGGKTNSVWKKIACLLTGFLPFGNGCSAKKDANGDAKAEPSSRLSGAIVIVEERDESESDEQTDGAGGDERKRSGESGETEDGEKAAGDNKMKGEVKVNAMVVETTTNEEGKTETDIEQIEAGGTLN